MAAMEIVQRVSRTVLIVTAKTLGTVSNFLYALSEQSRFSKLGTKEESQPLPDSENSEQWPEEWAKRIREAGSVRWFECKVSEQSPRQPGALADIEEQSPSEDYDETKPFGSEVKNRGSSPSPVTFSLEDGTRDSRISDSDDWKWDFPEKIAGEQPDEKEQNPGRVYDYSKTEPDSPAYQDENDDRRREEFLPDISLNSNHKNAEQWPEEWAKRIKEAGRIQWFEYQAELESREDIKPFKDKSELFPKFDSTSNVRREEIIASGVRCGHWPELPEPDLLNEETERYDELAERERITWLESEQRGKLWSVSRF